MLRRQKTHVMSLRMNLSKLDPLERKPSPELMQLTIRVPKELMIKLTRFAADHDLSANLGIVHILVKFFGKKR